MRTHIFLGIAGLVFVTVGCQNPVAPSSPDEVRPTLTPPHVNLQTGQSNRCRGEAISEVASTWPWPETHEDFPPPPGAVKLWLKILGPDAGVATVRELQDQACADGP